MAASNLAVLRSRLRRGGVIPAHPLALTARRRLDERRQRALSRYYLDAGAVGLAIGVHTTQFAIRAPKFGLYQPVLELGAHTARAWTKRPPILVAGLVGPTRRAVREAQLAADLGYHLGLLSLGGLSSWNDRELVAHAREVSNTLPIMGFYLQPAVGGRPLSHGFWRRFVEIDNVVAIKVAPFDRYQTLDVVRAVAASGRSAEIALYTGNDDAIVADLTTRFSLTGPNGAKIRLGFAGGLLGHWAFWTERAVRLMERAMAAVRQGAVPARLIAAGAATTDVNAAVFDAAHHFRGCIPGIHEILRRQGLLAGRWCLDPSEELSPGQMAEIDRVLREYPDLNDDPFVRDRLDRWLRP